MPYSHVWASGPKSQPSSYLREYQTGGELSYSDLIDSDAYDQTQGRSFYSAGRLSNEKLLRTLNEGELSDRSVGSRFNSAGPGKTQYGTAKLNRKIKTENTEIATTIKPSTNLESVGAQNVKAGTSESQESKTKKVQMPQSIQSNNPVSESSPANSPKSVPIILLHLARVPQTVVNEAEKNQQSSAADEEGLESETGVENGNGGRNAFDGEIKYVVDGSNEDSYVENYSGSRYTSVYPNSWQTKRNYKIFQGFRY